MADILKYPEDLTGINPTNLVSNEVKLLPRINNRGFAPSYGPFFAESFKLWHVATGKLLEPGVDYQILVMNQKATRVSGKLVCSLIYVNNPLYADEFRYTYQTIGDNWTMNVEAIQQMIDALQLDGRSIIWDDILDKPVLFPPAPHLHDVADWYGMEAVVDSIDNLTEAVKYGDVALKEQLLAQLANVQAQILALLSASTQTNLALGSLQDRVTTLEQ
jgi:hypothetical protein